MSSVPTGILAGPPPFADVPRTPSGKPVATLPPGFGRTPEGTPPVVLPPVPTGPPFVERLLRNLASPYKGLSPDIDKFIDTSMTGIIRGHSEVQKTLTTFTKQVSDIYESGSTGIEGGADVRIRQRREATALGRPGFTSDQKRKVDLARQHAIPTAEANAILRGPSRSTRKEDNRIQVFDSPGTEQLGTTAIFGGVGPRVPPAQRRVGRTVAEQSLFAGHLDTIVQRSPGGRGGGVRDIGEPIPPSSLGLSRAVMEDAIVGGHLIEARAGLRGNRIPPVIEQNVRRTLTGLSDLALRQRFEQSMARVTLAEESQQSNMEAAFRSALDTFGVFETGPAAEQFAQHFANAASAGVSDLALEDLELQQVDDVLKLYRQGRTDELVGAIGGEILGFVIGAPGKAFKVAGKLAERAVPGLVGRVGERTVAQSIARSGVEMAGAGIIEAPAIAERGRRDGLTPQEIATEVSATIAFSFFAGTGLSSAGHLIAGAARVGGRGAVSSARHAGKLYEKSMRGLMAVVDRAPEKLDDILPIVSRMANVGKEMEEAARRGLNRRRLYAIANALGHKGGDKAVEFLRKEAGKGLRQMTADEMRALGSRLQKNVKPSQPIEGPVGEFLRVEGGVKLPVAKTGKKLPSRSTMKIGDAVQAERGTRFRAFDRPDEIIGVDRSSSVGPVDFTSRSPFRVQFVDRGVGQPTISPISGRSAMRGAQRGEIAPSDVRRIFIQPEEIVDEAQGKLAKQLAGLKQRFPNAEIVQVREATTPDGALVVEALAPRFVKALETAGAGKPPGRPPIKPPVPPAPGPAPTSDNARAMMDTLDFLQANPIPLGLPGMGEPATIVANFITRSLVAMAGRTIERLGGRPGAQLVQTFRQFADSSAAMQGPWGERLRQIINDVPRRQRNELMRLFGGRTQLKPNQRGTNLHRALDDLKKLDDDVMQVVEATGIIKQDGSDFLRVRNYFAQPLERRFLNALDRFSRMEVEKVPESAKGMKRGTRKLFKDYNRAVDAVQEHMKNRLVRYDAGNKTVYSADVTEGVPAATDRVLRQEAQQWVNHHRGRLTGEFHRGNAFRGMTEATPEGLPVIPEGSVMLHREMIWPEDMIQPDFAINYSRHLGRLAEKVAERRLFGANNKNLNAMLKATVEHGQQHGNGDVLNALIRKLYEREVRVPAARYVFGIDPAEKSAERFANTARAISSRIILGPLSPFASGGNFIYAVYGLSTRVPVIQAMNALGIADAVVGAGVGGAIGFASGLADETLTPDQHRARTIGGAVAGGLAGMTTSVVRGTAARRLLVTPPVIGPLLRLLPSVERFTTRGPIERAMRAGALQGPGLEEVFARNPLREALSKGGVSQFITDFTTGSLMAWEQSMRAGSGDAVAAVVQKMQGQLVKAASQKQLGKFLASNEGKTILREMRRFGISRKTSTSFARRGELLNETMLNRARREGVRATQYILRALDTPIAWSSPWGKVTTQFWGMAYRQFVNTVGVAAHEAGNRRLATGAKVAVIGMAAGLANRELADMLAGRDLTPPTRRKLNRFARIFGNILGPLERAAAPFLREGPVADRLLEAVTPASISPPLDFASILLQETREMGGFAEEPLRGRQRGALEKIARIAPGVRAIQAGKERFFPSDEDLIRQHKAQLRQSFHERADAVESGGPIERGLRGAAADIGIPGIGADIGVVDEDLQDQQDQLMQSGARDATVLRNRALGKGPQTRAEAVNAEFRSARSSALRPIVDNMQRALQKKDRAGFRANLDRYFRGGGKAQAILNSLKARAGDPTKPNFFTDQVEPEAERVFRRELEVRKFTKDTAFNRLDAATFQQGQEIKFRVGREAESRALRSYLKSAFKVSAADMTASLRAMKLRNQLNRKAKTLESLPERIGGRVERLSQPGL